MYYYYYYTTTNFPPYPPLFHNHQHSHRIVARSSDTHVYYIQIPINSSTNHSLTLPHRLGFNVFLVMSFILSKARTITRKGKERKGIE